MTISRAVIDSYVRNYAGLVDQAIYTRGESVVVFTPLEATYNIYGEKDNEGYARLETSLLFNWDEYRTLLKFSDAYTESQIPLTASAALNDTIPTGSIVRVVLRNPDDVVLIRSTYPEYYTQEYDDQTIDYAVDKNEVQHEG